MDLNYANECTHYYAQGYQAGRDGSAVPERSGEPLHLWNEFLRGFNDAVEGSGFKARHPLLSDEELEADLSRF